MTKYIFVTGGVISSVGKGVVAASLGKILQKRGVKIAIQKLDPYINVDPGTMSPYQHGEVFVTNDGAETDLDLGHYERFLDINLTKFCSVTAGKIYAQVIDQERKGSYLGKTIQVIPHITHEIKKAIMHAAESMQADVLIVEVGGTVGDLEGAPFLEALRQMQYEQGQNNTLFVHVTWLPYVQATQELKTKPSQHSLRELRSIGIIPEIVIARADQLIDRELCYKIASFSNVHCERVIPIVTESNPYRVPLLLEEEKIGDYLVNHFSLLPSKRADWSDWKMLLAQSTYSAERKIKIALVGKYVGLHDAYISVTEALQHAAFELIKEIEIVWVDAEQLTEENVSHLLGDCKGIIVPGGFGHRAVEGKIVAAKWARIHKIPYLGLCLGMQVMCIEFAREVINKAATSLEFDEDTKFPVVTLMDQQKNIIDKGGTMRLGLYPCKLIAGTKAALAYQDNGQDLLISERHRHRFEFNNNYRKQLEDAGLIISGQSPDGQLVEIIELQNHPFMVASQFHPEFLSRPQKPHPLFKAFLHSV